MLNTKAYELVMHASHRLPSGACPPVQRAGPLGLHFTIKILFVNLPGNLSTKESRDSGDMATLVHVRYTQGFWLSGPLATTISSFKGKLSSEHGTRVGFGRAATLFLV